MIVNKVARYIGNMLILRDEIVRTSVDEELNAQCFHFWVKGPIGCQIKTMIYSYSNSTSMMILAIPISKHKNVYNKKLILWHHIFFPLISPFCDNMLKIIFIDHHSFIPPSSTWGGSDLCQNGKAGGLGEFPKLLGGMAKLGGIKKS